VEGSAKRYVIIIFSDTLSNDKFIDVG